jgi:molybdate transport system substrate-binding protein
MKRVFIMPIALAVLLGACSPAHAPTSAPTAAAIRVPLTTAPQARSLMVFAAASLTDAFREIGMAFEVAHPGVAVTFNFAGSQTLAGQIEQGAPADVFASASGTYMDAVVAAGFADKIASQVFVTNLLQVILPPTNPANVRSPQDLAKPGLKVVLADASVPAGRYARQILDSMSKDPAYGSDFSAKVLANVVSNETDVKQVVAKVQLNEADAGIVYVSDAIASPTLKTIDIPANLNVVANYPIAPLTKSAHPDLAAAFIAYVLSADGQATLKKWGFTPAK